MSLLKTARQCYKLALSLIPFCVILILLSLNSVHNAYPDEFDNLLGGYLLINKNIWLYKEYFSHHGPIAYIAAGLLTIFSGNSFVYFRLTTIIFYFMLFTICYLFFRKQSFVLAKLYLVYEILYALSATFFWGHMFLSDPLAGHFFIPASMFLFFKIYNKNVVTNSETLFISTLTSLGLFTSLSYGYMGLVTYAILGVYWLRSIDRNNLKKFFNFLLILIFPYIIFILYLILTNSFHDYYFQNLVYNAKYYIYNYPRPEGSEQFNPLRYAIVILNNYVTHMHKLLPKIKDLPFENPYALTLGLTNTSLLLYLLSQKKWLLTLFSFGILVYSLPRSDPFNTANTDYQSSVYVMLSFANITLLTNLIKNTYYKINEPLVKIVFTPIISFLYIMWLFFISLMFVQLWRMTYARFMGTMPLIYDRPQIAKVVNFATNPSEYCWVGPFELEEFFYLTCKNPSKYYWILPQFMRSQKIQSDLLTQFQKNKPTVIVYNKAYSNFGHSASENNFFNQFIDENYVLLPAVNIENKRYRFIHSKTQNFDLDSQFYIKKDSIPNVFNKLNTAHEIISD